MPTRVVVNGKNVFVSKDWVNPTSRTPVISKQLAVSHGTVWPPRNVTTLEHDGYPVAVLDYLDPLEGWVPLHVLVASTGADYSLVREWCRSGIVRAATTPGSPSRWYSIVPGRIPNGD